MEATASLISCAALTFNPSLHGQRCPLSKAYVIADKEQSERRKAALEAPTELGFDYRSRAELHLILGHGGTTLVNAQGGGGFVADSRAYVPLVQL